MNMTLGVVTMLWTQAGAPYFFPREKGLECGSALTCQGTAVLINNKFVTLAYARPVFLMSIRFMQPFCTCMQQKKVSITLYKVEERPLMIIADWKDFPVTLIGTF